ncbi:MAG: hypothetical protein ACTH6N_10775 [Brachybacterium tyrofermentans]|uniref:hypothetical protein n=1 Tax=Brachybacterium tyrofermentans TaxID=47848 RepID=UPI00186829AD|nr:hypothetical protein [Brachybacterium tyrofermentans]
MIRIRHLAAIAAVGVAGAAFAPSALADESSPAPAETATAAPASTVSPVGYADRTIQEFGAGDEIDFRSDTTADARSAIIAHEGAAKHWQRTTVEGAAGHVYVTYVNTETNDELTLGVNTTRGMDHDHLVDMAR